MEYQSNNEQLIRQAAEHAFYVLSDDKQHLGKIWNEHIQLQFELLMNAENQYLVNDVFMKSARNVLDIGCGEGLITKRLSDVYPNKRIVGIDKDKGALQKAALLVSNPNVAWVEKDILEAPNFRVESGPFDFIIARALLQHLQGRMDEFLIFCSANSRPGTLIYILEAYDAVRNFENPHAPNIIKMYVELGKNQQGRIDCITKVLEICHQHGFQKIMSEGVIMITGRDMDKKLTYEHYKRLMYLAYKLYVHDELLFEQSINDLEVWYKSRVSSSTFGVRIAKIQRF